MKKKVQSFESYCIRKLIESEGDSIDSPYTLLGIKYWYSRILQGEASTWTIWGPDVEWDKGAKPMPPQVALAEQTRNAPAYLFTKAAVDLVNDIPIDEKCQLTRSLLPFPFMFCVHEKPYSVAYVDNQRLAIAGCLIQALRSGLLLHHFGFVPDGWNGGFQEGLSITRSNIPWGKTVGQAHREREVEGDVGHPADHYFNVDQIIPWLVFINQGLLVEQPVETPPSDYRQRILPPAPSLPESHHKVCFVDLRKFAYAKREGAGGDGTPMDTDFRWWVSGHIRNQWYPKAEEHRPIFITPYLKGPEEAPIKPRAFRVIH
jgi:hypothetical protein